MAIFGINTPELGISEFLSDRLGKQRNAQGGSNLFGSPQAYAPAQSSPVQSYSQPNYQQYSAPIGPSNQGSVLGASTGGGARTVSQPQTFGSSLPQGILQSIPQQNGIDFDAMIAPALQGLQDAIGANQSSYQASLQGIDANTNKLRGEAQNALGQAETSATQSKQRNTQTTESAIDEARRQFSELQQGLQARYGGTTGTGQFASEIAGSQALKNIAGYRQNLSGAIQNIDDKLEQVRGSTQIYLRDLEDQATSQKSQAKAQLDQALNQIRQAQGELQGRKAELASNAIQIYQNQVNDINARNAQFLQQLYVQQTAAEQQLAAAKQRASQAASEFSLVNVPKGATPLLFNQASGQVQSPGAGVLNLLNNQDDNTDIFGG